jgi:hypothetical protein
MELSLVPAGSLNIAARDRSNRVPQSHPESPPPSWVAADPSILLRAYQPAANTFVIDTNFLQRVESIDQTGDALTWEGYPPQSARSLYQKSTTGQQSKRHTVDLYV